LRVVSTSIEFPVSSRRVSLSYNCQYYFLFIEITTT
jgi:hypothetical protein